jgi:hypothetical protein
VSLFGPEKVWEHLREFGRHPSRRVWNGLDRHHSDDEWSAAMEDGIASRRAEFWNPSSDQSEVHGDRSQAGSENHVNFDDDIDITRMVQEIFQDLDSLQEEAAQENSAHQLDRDEDVDMDELLNTTSEPLSEDFEWPQAIKDACRPLYEGARTSKLGYIMMFLNICGQHNVPNVCVTELLSLVSKNVLPQDNIAPRSHYEAKCLVTTLGLNYDHIHACPKGHMLFRGQYAKVDKCHICQSPRYLSRGKSLIPAKVLRHFPIAPRLLRMYRIHSIAEFQTWIVENQSPDGKVWHTGDSKQWKHVDSNPEMFNDFGKEARNIRLGLSLDGMSPFNDKNNAYSLWPVTLLNYNLPPWMVTKRFFVILALLILGPDSVVVANIDVFLAPLIDDLMELWYGVLAWDVVKSEAFTLRAMLLWCIHDYPAYGLASGISTKGYLGCVVCGPGVTSEYSKPLGKVLYRGHRRWLEDGHAFRTSRWRAKHFDGKLEIRPPPVTTVASDIIQWAEEKRQYDAAGGKSDGPDDPYKKYGVKRLSIFFRLPYWKVLNFIPYSYT